MSGKNVTDKDLAGWQPPGPPRAEPFSGPRVRLEPLAPGHAAALHRAFAGKDQLWDYMPYGPFADEAAYAAWVESVADRPDPMFFAILPADVGPPEGVASYLRVTPAHGTIEIGHICLSPALQGTARATEAFFLMADRVFASGYRRYEWKCNAGNLPSRRAAQRLGFSFEGIFRQHMVIKARNRDTAWLAMTDADWQNLRPAYLHWLDPSNFDAEGRQRKSLSELTAPWLAARDPAL